MIRVTIDLIPYGDQTKAETLSTIDIWNVKKPFTKDVHQYEYKLLIKGKDELQESTGVVFHNRKLPVFYLVKDVIESILRKVVKDA